jgi:hypothetical protein
MSSSQILAGLIIACQAGTSPVLGLDGDAKRIAVVKTWKELLAQPQIDLGDGVRIRLGMERARIPHWSGALLYCVTEGYTPSVKKRNQLGPVYVACIFEKEKMTEEKTKAGRKAREDLREHRLLFSAAIVADRVGEYQIQVRDETGRLRALGRIDCTPEHFHPWMPWFFLREFDLFPKTNLVRGIALPTWSSHDPVAIIKHRKQPVMDLPTFLPQTCVMKLALQGKDLLVQSEEKFIVSRPHGHFLARWWVNDRPFVPAQTQAFWDESFHELITEDKELRLPLQFEHSYLGSRQGDRIGVQLLYCRDQWQWVGRKHQGGSSGTDIRVSKRVDFISK